MALAAGLVATWSAAIPAGEPAYAASPTGGVPHEMFAPDGTISRVDVPSGAQPTARSAARASAASVTVTPVEVHGPSGNRLDIVFVGDGYTQPELGTYAAQASRTWELLANREPFRSYRTLFNVWRVDLVSPVSGVSGDPTADVSRDTPLAASYWCDGLQRLLCADIEQVKHYAGFAPDADQVAVLANSGMYGGAGYTEEEVATFAGGHPLAAEILPHELGHSIGDLADEYDYYAFPDDGSRYRGPEPAEANISKKNADQLLHPRKKWWYWLGADTPDGGVIDAYEGGYYTQFGIYRPSQNSLMKALRREFNVVSREKMIQSFYATTRPIDAAVPSGAAVARGGTLAIEVLAVPLQIRWFVDGSEVPAWRGRTSVSLADGPPGAGSVSVEVSDQTSWVRSTEYRAQYLTQRHSWRVSGG
ncbi:M64 family metallopeptidase [Micromonospora sp. NBC_01412]|uniref:M64 family metallopeptidase n=1 Tax=Micromonospora sp. NBC_01412 TaxID=2903590 RepID=UPI00324526D2